MIELVEKNGIKFFQSDKLLSPHGFSTRVGGVSTLPHTASLNLAFGLGDEEKTVLENVRRFSNAVGIDADLLISVPQIHSALVRSVSFADVGAGVSKQANFSCDGYVASQKGLPIGVKTADCVPLLLEARDAEGGVIAVAALHAGWRGTVLGIARVGIEKLVSVGAAPERIFVAIGPCIHRCCYEVGKDFVSSVQEKLGQNYDEKYITADKDGSLFADIVEINRDMLLSCGVPEGNIDISPLCTCCHTELFYSHRATGGLRGSMMSVIQK